MTGRRHCDRPQPPDDQLARSEREVLRLLLDANALLSVGDVARYLGDPGAARRALAALHRDGLVSRSGHIVCATPAAARLDQLAQA